VVPPIVVAVADGMEVVVTFVGTRVPFTGATQYPTPRKCYRENLQERTLITYQFSDLSILDQD